jgi:hypothetical protein
MGNRNNSTNKPDWLVTVSWLLIALAFLAFFLVDLRLDYEQIQQPCTGAECNYTAVSQAEMDVLEAWGLNGQIFSLIVNGSTLLAVTLFWVLGGIIFWRQGATRAGWFFSLAFPGWFFLFGDEFEFPAGEVRLLATMLGWPMIITMLMALLLTIAMAILRYRLWDIDVVIRRTLQYSLITGLLGLVYLGGVTVLQGVFTAVSGQESPAAVVLSTLGIAALFNPLRHRILLTGAFTGRSMMPRRHWRSSRQQRGRRRMWRGWLTW